MIFKKIKEVIRKSSPPRLIAGGFAFVILTGALLLMLPVSIRKGATV